MLHVIEAEVGERIKELLDAAVRGEEVVVERSDRSYVRLVRREGPRVIPANFETLTYGDEQDAEDITQRLPSNAAFRATITPARTSSAEIVCQLRDEERA